MSTAVADQPIIDVSQVETDALPEKPFPPGSIFRVLITDEAYQTMQEHARSTLAEADMIREVGGVLIGNIFRDAAGPYLEIKSAIIAEHTRNEGTEVAFTPETWAQLNRVKDKLYPTDRVVGWYHTHPRFGIFLSERDKFIHRHSFPQPWAVAFVIDPVQEQEGLFLWCNDEPREASEYWVGAARKLHISRAGSTPAQSLDIEQVSLPTVSRTTFMATLSLCLALLLLVGGFFYRNELRLTQEIQLLARALNSQQQELDRALQDLSTLQSYVNFTTQQNAANDERISGALKQLEESLLTVDVIGQSLRQRVANLDNHGPTGAATPPANGHSDKKP